jgi:hypothetical protein
MLSYEISLFKVIGINNNVKAYYFVKHSEDCKNIYVITNSIEFNGPNWTESNIFEFVFSDDGSTIRVFDSSFKRPTNSLLVLERLL